MLNVDTIFNPQYAWYRVFGDELGHCVPISNVVERTTHFKKTINLQNHNKPPDSEHKIPKI